MIDYTFDENNLLLHIKPKDKLQKQDFVMLSTVIDPVIEHKGHLAGIIIETKEFPGWKDFSALIHHFEFVKQHHRKVEKIAVVTDSKVADLGEKLASHFVAAEIKKFPFGDVPTARKWILDAQAGID